MARRLKLDGLKKPASDKLCGLYWTSNKSLRQIARLYETSDTTIIRWMKRYGIARQDKSAAKHWLSFYEARIKLRKKFVAYPSETLVYVLAVLPGDGFVCKHKPSKHYQIGPTLKVRYSRGVLRSTDRDRS